MPPTRLFASHHRCILMLLLVTPASASAYMTPIQLTGNTHRHYNHHHNRRLTISSYNSIRKTQLHSLETNARSKSANEDPSQSVHAHLSSATPYNKDIARTLFPQFFFTLYHHQNNAASNDRHEPQIDNNIRLYLKRSSPFQDPTSAQTAERMLRRMMENRYQSDGRTACPDSRTFNLVAGAFGRLRYRYQRGTSTNDVRGMPVAWEEEPKINPQHRGNAENGQSYNQIITSSLNGCTEMNSAGAVVMEPVMKLQELLQLHLQLCHYEGWPHALCPSVEVYNRILKRLATADIQMQGNAVSALKIFHLMQSPLPVTGDDVLCAPNAMTCLHVIRALSRHRPATAGRPNKRSAASKATLQSIETMSEELEVGVNAFTIPVNATTDWFLEKAENVLAVMKEFSTTGSEYYEAAAILLEAWNKFAVTATSEVSIDLREKAIDHAYALLCNLEEMTNMESPPVNNISSRSYASVLLGLSVSNRKSAANDAEEILNRMIEQATFSASSDPKDFATAFSACIAACAHEPPRAEAILYKMIEMYESSVFGDEFVPDVRAFGTCIAAWAKYVPANAPSLRHLSEEQRVQNADRAEAVLKELERLAEREWAKGNKEFELHATPYNIALHARVQTVHRIQKKDYPHRSNFLEDEASNEKKILHAMSLLDHMEYKMHISPDSFTYSILLNAWVQQSRPGNEVAADRAEELLLRKTLSSDLSLAAGKHIEQDVWPNVKHYSSVLKAHAKSKSAGGAKKALAILSEMERRYSNANIISNKEMYDEDTDTTYHVEDRDVAKPDIICYSIVIDAFVHSRLPEAGMVSYRLLGALENKYEAGDFAMKPNTRIYTAVVQALIHSQFIGSVSNGVDLTPNRCMDEEVATDMLQHKWINNAQVAMHILERMKEKHVLPNAFTYNYIINCAAECMSDHSSNARISFEVAVRAFQELRSLNDAAADTVDTDNKPDSFTYAFMLKACNNLLPIGSSLHTKTVTQTFRECCRKGHLNRLVLDRLYNGMTTEKFFDAIGIPPPTLSSSRRRECSVDLDDLPREWSRNVRNGRASHRKSRMNAFSCGR